MNRQIFQALQLAAALGVAVFVAPAPAIASSASGGLGTPDVTTSSTRTAGSVHVMPRYKAGDSFTVHIDKSGHVEQGVKKGPMQHQAMDVRIRVLSNDAQGARLDCVFGKGELMPDTDPAIRLNPVVKVMMNAREGVHAVIVTGPRFTNPRVGNVDELLAGFSGTLDKAVAVMPPEIGPKVKELIGRMMENRDAFAMKVVEDVFVYLAMSDVDVPVGNAIYSSSQSAVLGSATPVKQWTSLRIDKNDKAAQRVTLVYRATSNPKDLGEAAKEIREQVSGDAAASSGLQAIEDGVYDIDLKTGLPVSARRERHSEAGDQKAIETIVFTKKK